MTKRDRIEKARTYLALAKALPGHAGVFEILFDPTDQKNADALRTYQATLRAKQLMMRGESQASACAAAAGEYSTTASKVRRWL